MEGQSIWKLIIGFLLLLVILGGIAYILIMNFPGVQRIFTQSDGVNIRYGKLICKEFKDKNKNYVPGEILVTFRPKTTFAEVQNFLTTINTSLHRKNPNEKITIKDADPQSRIENGLFLVLLVPEDSESTILSQYLNNPLVKNAELNGCNNGAGPL